MPGGLSITLYFVVLDGKLNIDQPFDVEGFLVWLFGVFHHRVDASTERL